MEKRIIKTSAQAKAEKDKINEDAVCPECNHYPNLSYYYYDGKIFSPLMKVNVYTCFNCGCQWETKKIL